MSEIEKMYENAGLSNMWVERYNDGYYEHERYYNSYKEMINNMMKANDWTLTEAQEVAKRECRKELPPFTAEKLINLEMFLINKGEFGIKKGSVDITFESFTSCIAGLINNLWQSLTQEERKQIKIILQEDNQ